MSNEYSKTIFQSYLCVNILQTNCKKVIFNADLSITRKFEQIVTAREKILYDFYAGDFPSISQVSAECLFTKLSQFNAIFAWEFRSTLILSAMILIESKMEIWFDNYLIIDMNIKFNHNFSR